MIEKVDVSLFSELEHEFYRHISDEDNTRILFSGKFGIGKSTFISYFFSDSDFSDQYQVIKLNPINYSVLANEDIMTYVKYDILNELSLIEEDVFESELISLMNSSVTYVQYNALQLLSSLILLVPKFGKQGYQFFDIVNRHYDKFIEIKARAEDEMKLVNDFMVGLEKNENSHYENSLVTQLIEKVIDRISVNKEKILVVDDLDRIDPSHIFRIINVLSANMNNKFSGETKFGFDKIILVCDEYNIRNIYKSNYGNEVDYNGYIDKFFSKHIFSFNNRSVLHKYVENVCLSFNITGEDNQQKQFIYEITKVPRAFIATFASDLIQINQLNLRTVNKWIGKKIVVPKKVVRCNSRYNFINQQLGLVVLFDLLIECFGSYDKLYELVDLASKYQFKITDDAPYIIGECALLVDHDTHKFRRNSDREKNYEASFLHRPNKGINYRYELSRRDFIPRFYAITPGEGEINWGNHFEILKEALIKLRDFGYF